MTIVVHFIFFNFNKGCKSIGQALRLAHWSLFNDSLSRDPSNVCTLKV